jgi:DNA-binding CsgD family transcriptional regulator
MRNPPRNNRSNLSHEEITSMYLSGKSSLEIARAAGVSYKSILNCLRRHGVERRSGNPPRKHDREAIASRYMAGETFTEIAISLGVHVSTIRGLVVACGVSLRPGKDSALRGEKHHWWKGGTQKTSDGYLETKDGRLHRVVVEQHFGHKLESWEDVHHVDGDKLNSGIDNLVVMPAREHTRFHTFLKHRDLPTTAENLRNFCRQESDHYYRFTKDDCMAATAKSPLNGRSALIPLPKPCRVPGCGKKRAGLGYCSLHYQRRQAIRRGGWISGKGRTSTCRRVTIT